VAQLQPWWRQVRFVLLEFFLPRLCVFCRAVVGEKALVAVWLACEATITWVAGPLCPTCGRVVSAREGADHLCGPYQTEPPPFTRSRGAGPSDAEVTDLFAHAEVLARRLAGL
jgi:hypothetical protein